MGGCAALLVFVMAQAAGGSGTETQQGPPALIVQVVDPLWLPMPGIAVAVIPASGAEQQVGRTGQKGFTEFWLPRGAEYSVEVHSRGFKKRRVEHVRVGRSTVSPTAYVQVQLEPRPLGGSAE